MFKNLDLYKVIILVSLLALPGVGFWAYTLHGQIEDGRKAIRDAVKPGGELMEIGKFQKAVEEQRRNRNRGTAEDYNTYFDKQIQGGGGGLSAEDFKITRKPDQRTKNAVDTVVGISFKKSGRETLAFGRDFLMAVLFNCESQSPMWKLREIKVRNRVLARTLAGSKEPPAELPDEWEVMELEFASRRPQRAQ